jgi:parvulin-like peptidyl-prolyl isomerase
VSEVVRTEKEARMKVRNSIVLVLSLLLAVCVVSCAKKGKEGALKVKTGLALRVDDVKITEQEMQRRFEELPDKQQSEFKGQEGQAKFADRLIEQELLHRAAIDKGLDKDGDVRRKIDNTISNILAGEYFAKYVEENVKVTDGDIAAYYNEHKNEFVNPPVLRAQYLYTVDSLKAVGWFKRLKAGANFNKIAKDESEDRAVAPALGDLGYFNLGGYARAIGANDNFTKAVDSLSVGELSHIIRLDKGYGIVKLTERNPVKVQELANVSKMIESKLMRSKSEDAYKQEIDRLKTKYPTENYVREVLSASTRTAEELWQMAQMEEDPRQRIQYYRDIVSLYPTDKNAPQALFMIGFAYAEDLQDFVQARRTFDELEKKYPQSDLIQSANWMIDNMEKPGPRFDSYEKMQKAMESGKGRPDAGGK